MKAQPNASHYINGRFVEDEQGAALSVLYPATGEEIARLHSATPNIIELAVEAAREAQPAWARLKPVERGRILRRAVDILRERNDELARLETLDTGKSIPKRWCVDIVRRRRAGVLRRAGAGLDGEQIWRTLRLHPSRAAGRRASVSARGTTRSRSPCGSPHRPWPPVTR